MLISRSPETVCFNGGALRSAMFAYFFVRLWPLNNNASTYDSSGLPWQQGVTLQFPFSVQNMFQKHACSLNYSIHSSKNNCEAALLMLFYAATRAVGLHALLDSVIDDTNINLQIKYIKTCLFSFIKTFKNMHKNIKLQYSFKEEEPSIRIK